MAMNLTINSSNLVNNGFNNTYQYNFINGAVNIPEGSTMSVSQITIPYSWRNISARLGNNTYSYSMPNGASGTTTYGSYTIPDGFYTVSQLNTLIHQQFNANGHYWYLHNSTGINNNTYVYPLSITSNVSAYTNTITAYNIPLTGSIVQVIGAGYVAGDGNNGSTLWSGTYPTGGVTFTGRCCQITFSGTNQSATTTFLGNVLGFTPASYPTTATGLTALTSSSNGNTLTSVPSYPALGSVVNGVIVRCNMVDNNISSPSDILTSLPIDVAYGSNLNYQPINDNKVKIRSGKYNNVTVYFADQNNNNLLMLDPNVLITLIINFNGNR
jgi:hypothetical protein